MSALSRSRTRLARRLGWFAVVSLVAAALVPPTFAAPGDKVTICHATSGSKEFVAITVDESSAYTPHLDDKGSPLNGHEDDFLLQGEQTAEDCRQAANPTPTPTPTPTPVPTPTPTPVPTPTPTPVPTPTPTPTPTGGVGGATATPPAPAATPGTTLPPTDTLGDASTTTGNDSWRIILLALAATLASALLLTPARVVRKDR